jgi:glycerol-3-phosphate acyltransferase PlsX
LSSKYYARYIDMTQSSGRFTIAVDAMGGDFAPDEVIKGSIAASTDREIEVILVGPQETLHNKLSNFGSNVTSIRCVNASEQIREGEPPAIALRQKRDASIVVAMKMVKSGEADAVVSAGPTGAVVASSLVMLGMVEGVERPAFGGTPVGITKDSILLDCGGNVDCKPEHLLSFAVIGSVYVRKLMGIENPTVALLSVGSEEGKGNELVKESFPLFRQSGLNFIGNAEGNDIVDGKANVIVCDGFTGNVLLKFCEGFGSSLNRWLSSRLEGKLPDDEKEKICSELFSITNTADMVGGVPLLGVNGNVIVMHGRSRATLFASAIKRAKDMVQSGFIETLNSELIRTRRQLKNVVE